MINNIKTGLDRSSYNSIRHLFVHLILQAIDYCLLIMVRIDQKTTH